MQLKQPRSCIGIIVGVRQMPNSKAKTRKQKRRQLNEKWKKEGRTAVQHKKWLEKNKDKSQTPVYGR